MNCKKCNSIANGEIFCDSCSDEILKLYLIEKLRTDEIEKMFNLLPNTVDYWYNHCKMRNGDNFSYLVDTNKVNLECKEAIEFPIYNSRIFSRLTSFIVLSSVLYFPIVFFLVSFENVFSNTPKVGGFYLFFVPLVFIQSNLSLNVIVTLPIMLSFISNKLKNIIKNLVYLSSFFTFTLSILVGYYDTIDTVIIFFSNAYLIFPLMICIMLSSIKSIVKIYIYLSITIYFYIISLKLAGALETIGIILLIMWLFSIYDIFGRKKQYVDIYNQKLSNISIVERNILKFFCISNLIVPIIYYFTTKHILWDDITNTRYVL